MNETKLGQLVLDGNKDRDAVHIAVIPMIAGDQLKPGMKVIVKDNMLFYCNIFDAIGIVDPFLKEVVEIGQTCYLCLYPNTITSLKHNWTHPAFPDEKPVFTDKDKSIQWIRDFAADRLSIGSRLLMEIAEARIEEGEGYYYFSGQNEDYKDVTDGEWNEFWKHYAVVTNQNVAIGRIKFSCSC